MQTMQGNVLQMLYVCITCASIVPGKQIHNDESQEAFEGKGYFSNISDKSVVL